MIMVKGDYGETEWIPAEVLWFYAESPEWGNIEIHETLYDGRIVVEFK